MYGGRLAGGNAERVLCGCAPVIALVAAQKSSAPVGDDHLAAMSHRRQVSPRENRSAERPSAMQRKHRDDTQRAFPLTANYPDTAPRSGSGQSQCDRERTQRETSMHWYVSYRTGGSMLMHVFKKRKHAIAAACGCLNRGYHDALEVGPILGSPEGKVLDERDIRRIRDENPGAATPDSDFRAVSTTSSRT